jgi:hypothetical protein
MKQFIVLIAMIAFGVFMYGVIAGAGDASLTRMSGKALHEAALESFRT